MSRVLYLRDVLQFIIYSFDDCPLAQENLVRDAHHSTFHVALEFCDELYAINEEFLEEILADVSLVSDELVKDLLNEALILQRLPVIYIPWCHHEIQQLSLFIAYQVQLEAKEPPHGTLTTSSEPFESLMNMNSLIAADTQWCGINKAYAGTLTKQNLLDEYNHGDDDFLLKLHESVVGYSLREKML